MVKVNGAALPSALIEPELFGREKRALTGARSLGRPAASRSPTARPYSLTRSDRKVAARTATEANSMGKQIQKI
ncbi:hypothetical protein ACVWY2_007581 [Bradyrhizobium sp. JR6.1]